MCLERAFVSPVAPIFFLFSLSLFFFFFRFFCPRWFFPRTRAWNWKRWSIFWIGRGYALFPFDICKLLESFSTIRDRLDDFYSFLFFSSFFFSIEQFRFTLRWDWYIFFFLLGLLMQKFGDNNVVRDRISDEKNVSSLKRRHFLLFLFFFFCFWRLFHLDRSNDYLIDESDPIAEIPSTDRSEKTSTLF